MPLPIDVPAVATVVNPSVHSFHPNIDTNQKRITAETSDTQSHDLEPRVLVAYETTNRSITPRRIRIARKRREYRRVDIATELRNVYGIDYGRVNQNTLPLTVFDDEDFDERSLAEWNRLGAVGEGFIHTGNRITH